MSRSAAPSLSPCPFLPPPFAAQATPPCNPRCLPSPPPARSPLVSPFIAGIAFTDTALRHTTLATCIPATPQPQAQQTQCRKTHASDSTHSREAAMQPISRRSCHVSPACWALHATHVATAVPAETAAGHIAGCPAPLELWPRSDSQSPPPQRGRGWCRLHHTAEQQPRPSCKVSGSCV